MRTVFRRKWVERAGSRQIPSNLGVTLMGGPGNERIAGAGGSGNSNIAPVGALSYFTGAAPTQNPVDPSSAAFSYSFDGSQPARTWNPVTQQWI